MSFVAAMALNACQERYVQYEGAEYVMFADTLQIYPIQENAETFSIPVVSTVKRSYDRTFGVEVIDKIANVETGNYGWYMQDVPVEAVVIETMEIVSE